MAVLSLRESVLGGSFHYLIGADPYPWECHDHLNTFLKVRPRNALERAGLWSPEGFLGSTRESLLSIDGVGKATVDVIERILAFYGLGFGVLRGDDLMQAIADERRPSRPRQTIEGLLNNRGAFDESVTTDLRSHIRNLEVLCDVVPEEGIDALPQRTQDSARCLASRRSIWLGRAELEKGLRRARALLADAERCTEATQASTEPPIDLVRRTLSGLIETQRW